MDNVHALSRFKLFLGLSRTPHALLDVATPAMAALLYLGHFPDVKTIIIGLLTAFAGYTAVYSLNDIVDVSIDKERLSLKPEMQNFADVDEIFARHPVAQDLIPFREALIWFFLWALIAIVGAWALNPYCGLLFIVSATLEAVYCKLLKISHLKIIPSAIVKASGGVAGVLAVDPNPSPAFVGMLIFWLAAWEIGGQNIANDIVDMENDAMLQARTTLTVRGLNESVFYLVFANGMTFFGSLAIYAVAGKGLGFVYPIGAIILGWLLIIKPTREIFMDPKPLTAGRLFNRASYLPVSFLVLTAISCMVPF